MLLLNHTTAVSRWWLRWSIRITPYISSCFTVSLSLSFMILTLEKIAPNNTFSKITEGGKRFLKLNKAFERLRWIIWTSYLKKVKKWKKNKFERVSHIILRKSTSNQIFQLLFEPSKRLADVFWSLTKTRKDSERSPERPTWKVKKTKKNRKKIFFKQIFFKFWENRIQKTPISRQIAKNHL